MSSIGPKTAKLRLLFHPGSKVRQFWLELSMSVLTSGTKLDKFSDETK